MSRKRSHLEAFTEHIELFADFVRNENCKTIESSEEFLKVLEENSEKFVVLMGHSFSITACAQMRGIFNDLASKFPGIIFIEVDTDKEEDITRSQNLEVMPTFIIYRNSKAIDRIEGAFPETLSNTLCNLCGIHLKKELPNGIEDLVHYVNIKKSECLNCSDETPYELFLTRKTKLISDCDSSLLLSYGFNQAVKLHSVKIQSPIDTGPSSIKIFVNQLKSMDFDDASSLTCSQEIKLSEEDLKGNLVELHRVKFQNVTNVYLFIPENQSESEVTEINSLTLFGEPVQKSKGITGQKTSIIRL